MFRKNEDNKPSKGKRIARIIISTIVYLVLIGVLKEINFLSFATAIVAMPWAGIIANIITFGRLGDRI